MYVPFALLSQPWPLVVLPVRENSVRASSDTDRSPHQTANRPPLAAPDAFFPGNSCGELTFTNGADRELVAHKWRDTCQHIFRHAKDLFFQNAWWGDEEMASLAQVLPLCQKLTNLSPRGNAFTFLPPALCALTTLETLTLTDCTLLTDLPEALAELPQLKQLNLEGCTALKAVPPSLRERAKRGKAAGGIELRLPPHLRQ